MMSKHNILISKRFDSANIEPPQMSGQSFGTPSGERQGQRPAAFSLFRQGQVFARPPMALDHRVGREVFAAPIRAVVNSERTWESLGPATLNVQQLAGNGLFVNANQSPVTATFDILRTRILQMLEERNWKRIAITSPTHGCGKSFVAANLALSLARMPSRRTILMDMELRSPELAGLLGVGAGPIRDFLSGDLPFEAHFRRVGRNLALALNGERVPASAEQLHEDSTEQALDAMVEHLKPDVVLFDLPPALGNDDVIAMLPHIDAILVIADGTHTSPEDLRRCEHLFDGHAPLLGVVLNRAQDRKSGRYRYGKK